MAGSSKKTSKKTTRKSSKKVSKKVSKKAPRKTTKKTRTTSPRTIDATGKHLVIVESPAKAKTINRYLGPDFIVRASVGHVRDLPKSAPKGTKQPVPGVDIENSFEPTYEVLADKKKVIAELKKIAKQAADVWFATDLDREGEAIAWHLAEVLNIEPERAKRVVFNAITRDEITRAFSTPTPIDTYKVNAQQARRVLDRIVGYQVSPLLWKKVASKLSAGRVQSVAVRLVADREQLIRDFVPEEHWKVQACMSLDPACAAQLVSSWAALLTTGKNDGRPTIKVQNAWLAEHAAIKAELVEVDGTKFDVRNAGEGGAVTDRMTAIAEATGLQNIDVQTTDNPEGRGPAKTLVTVNGTVDPAARYEVKSIETKRSSSRPAPPFITSTLQIGASNLLSFGAQRTMRVAQSLYEGVNVPGEGQVGLITYMRTDSTHLSGDAINEARGYIKDQFGDSYLPDKAKVYSSSNKSAQEAHEAIRPTDVRRHPDSVAQHLNEDQRKLYNMIWRRFVACQMMPAQWDSTTVLLHRIDSDHRAIFKTMGRVLVFDGFYRVLGVPTSSDEQTLPELTEKQHLAPFAIEPEQLFTNPPPRFSEASLVKELEAKGIGRPSTYAQIIQVIQYRNYVEQIERRFHATDLGEVVTQKLIEGFPDLMDFSYTRRMEEELDRIESAHTNWTDMLKDFYKDFSSALEKAHETMGHAKAETQPAIYECPECKSKTSYRFGQNGRFLSCSAYPECKYGAQIDRQGRPLLPQRVDVACPADGSKMILRSGRFGKFLASEKYPEIDFVVNLDKKGQIKYPSPPPVVTDLLCEKCEAPLNLRRGKRGPWLGCSKFPKCRGRAAWGKLDQAVQDDLTAKLEAHEKENPQKIIYDLKGDVIPEGTPIETLIIEGEVQELQIHPDAEQPST